VQMGFTRLVVPATNVDPAQAVATGREVSGEDGDVRGTCELVGVRTVGEALDALLP
jgi:hypothetical protein